MADNMENLDQPGVQGLPNPDASGTGNQAASAVTAETLAAIVERLDKIERGQQSTKDKRIAKLLQKQDDFDEKLARLQALTNQGVSQDDALWRIKVEDALAAKLNGEDEGGVGQGKQVGNQAPAPSVDTENILKTMGLDPASAEVTAILRETDDFTAQVAKFAALAQTRKAQTKPAPQSQQMPSGGGSPVLTEDVETLTGELQKLMREPSKNIAKIQEVNAKLRGLTPTK